MPPLRSNIFLAAMLMLALVLSWMGLASAADFEFSPRISTTAEYNDNVNQTKKGTGDYLWIIKPGMSATYEHSRIFADVSYDFEFKKYLEKKKSDEDNHYLKALTKVEAIKEFFYIEVSDNYKKVFLDATQGDRPEGDTSVNTTDQNTLGVKPYFVIPLQKRTNLTAGGEFKDIWYANEGSVDKRSYRLFSDVTHELTEQWSLTGGVGAVKSEPRFEEGGYRRYNVSLGTRYSYAEGSSISASISPTYTEYDIEGTTQYNPYSVSIIHAFSDTFIGTASTSMGFSEDPGSSNTLNNYSHQVGLTKKYGRGEVNCGLAYHDYETTDGNGRSTYWRPNFGGSHSLTDRLSFNYNTYLDLHSNPTSNKYIFSRLGLSYSLSEHTSATLSYRFKSRDKKGLANDYTSNTIGLTLSWYH